MRVIYGLNGIAQVGEKVCDGQDSIAVKNLNLKFDPPYIVNISNYRLDSDYSGTDKVVTTIEEINNYYDERIKNRLEQNKIDESRRERAIESYNKYLK